MTKEQELLRFQMELARWDKHIEHAIEMKQEIHKRIDTLTSEIELQVV